MARIARYCRVCLCFKSFGPDGGPCPDLEWLEEPCDWCMERERVREAEVRRLEELWAARECAAADCSVVFVPLQARQRFHSDQCRKRTHRRLKAGAVSTT